MNTQTDFTPDLVMIPVADLSVSPLNTRQTVPEADIEALAESLCINGLIQNLSGLLLDDSVGIVAGGKRLRALQLIAAHPDRFTTPHALDPVPVRVTTDEATARDWAGAENEARSDPHPADQITAYRDMAAKGADPAKIALAYAKTEAHVKGRLKLAQLPDTAITALRQGKINLDAAKALTLARDPAHLDRVLENLAAHPHLDAGYIRRELADGRIPATDRRAVFVGLETYEAEGGKVTADLFEGRSLLHDEETLNALFAAKLALKAEQVEQDEGWSWTAAVGETYIPQSHHDRHSQIYPVPGELSQADMDEFDRLAELAGADAINDQDLATLEALRRRLDGDFSDAQRETAGAVVLVKHNGELEIRRGYVRRGDETGSGAGSDDGVTRIETKPKPPITQRGTEDLQTIATLALQTVLIDKPDLLLDLLAYQLESKIYGWSAPLHVQTDQTNISPTEGDEITTSAKLTAQTTIEGATPMDQFAAFQALGKKHRNTVLARNLARTANRPMQSDFGKALFKMTGASMRKVWTPTATNFFSSCSVGMLESLWSDLLQLEDDDARHAEFAKLKKGEKAKALEALLSDASIQEAHGLSRDQVKALDAWVPADFAVED